MRTHVCTIAFAFALALTLVAAPALADDSGGVAGKVVDESGAGLPGVTVVITGPTLTGQHAAITGADGTWTLKNIPAGVYTVTFYYGDQTVTRKNVAVAKKASATVNVKIDTSLGAETITIESTSLSIDQVKNIPIPGRTFEGALGTAAGSTSDGLGVSFSGSTSLESQYVVDGINTSSETYVNHGTNPMTDTRRDRFSTFAIDVDTASYTIMRTKVEGGQRPPPASVRVEEYLNYFDYDYAPPADNRPFAVHFDAAPSPYNDDRVLLRVGVAARRVSDRDRKPANLVFLVDVSGSMSSEDKLGLAKKSLHVLLDELDERDSVALVTYAGNTRVVLPPTGLRDKDRISAAINDLNSGGSTAMGAGIELAYQLADKKLDAGSVSRVIVLSDGDANVGNTGHDAILETIADKVERGVTLTTVGFGMGNYQDHKMEQLANKGNGNNFYIDDIDEAKKIFGRDFVGTLEVVAKDVKVQVEMNPRAVRSYRLVGYENRDIADEDFRKDKVDAGEIGAGHTVTAMYEVELTSATRGALATVRLRSKTPRGKKAAEVAYRFDRSDLNTAFRRASADFRFATAVVGAAEILRKSPAARRWRLDRVIAIAEGATRRDQRDRVEFIELMKAVAGLEPHPDPYIPPHRVGGGSSPEYIAVGAGVGGLLIRGGNRSQMAPMTTLRVGVGRGLTDLTIHLGASRRAAESTVSQISTPVGDSLSMYSMGALLSTRLLPRASIRPVGGLGVESLIVSPRIGGDRMAFAALARLGVEVTVPTSLGDFALGVDATGHMPLVTSDRMPMELDSMLTFGTYLDARF